MKGRRVIIVLLVLDVLMTVTLLILSILPVSRIDELEGRYVNLPGRLARGCFHIIAVDGACLGCERLVDIAPDAIYITDGPHPRNNLFPNLVIDFWTFWFRLQVRSIPAEYVIINGRIVYAEVATSTVRNAPSCPPSHD